MVLKELGNREILSLLLESGPKLNGAALAAGAVDKLVLFYAPKLGGDTGVPFANFKLKALPHFRMTNIRQFGPDLAIELLPQHSQI